jgi:hypothetical protein
MATEPKPGLPSADECVQLAWSAAQEAQSRGLPMSSQAAFWQESQAWSLLSMALRGQPAPKLNVATGGNAIQSVPQPPTPAPVARHKSGPKPKPKPDIPKSNFDVVEELRRKWEQEG